MVMLACAATTAWLTRDRWAAPAGTPLACARADRCGHALGVMPPTPCHQAKTGMAGLKSPRTTPWATPMLPLADAAD